MKRAAMLIFLLALLACASGAKYATPPASAPAGASVSFIPVHVFIDPHGKLLACYQITIIATAGDAKLVGIEGGDAAAFNAAPYYDPRALQGNRVIIGAYSLGKNLPAENTRVATLMFRVAGNIPPRFAATVDVAVDADVKAIDATVSLPASAPPQRMSPDSPSSTDDPR